MHRAQHGKSVARQAQLGLCNILQTSFDLFLRFRSAHCSLLLRGFAVKIDLLLRLEGFWNDERMNVRCMDC